MYSERVVTLRVAFSSILAVDYLGSLLGALLFPLWLMPRFGLMGAGLILGCGNALVAWWTAWLLRLPARRLWRGVAWGVLVVLGVLLWRLSWLEDLFDRYAFRDKVYHRERSAYQEIVLTKGAWSSSRLVKASSQPTSTDRRPPKAAISLREIGGLQRSQGSYIPHRWKDDLRLFLRGRLQFSALDEYRYHEALIHPAFLLHRTAKRILLLGGGDGMALREILKYRSVERVVLVDIDAAVIALFRRDPALRKLNQAAFDDPRLQIITDDAFSFLQYHKEKYDLIFADLPDPSTPSLAKLYSRFFYKKAASRLQKGGYLAVQASSPFFAPRVYGCIGQTLKDAGFWVYPYHVYVHSFGGAWGFHLATQAPARLEKISNLEIPTRYLTEDNWKTMFLWPPDLRPQKRKGNRLLRPRLMQYYAQDAAQREQDLGR
jgi:spermidine synthase